MSQWKVPVFAQHQEAHNYVERPMTPENKLIHGGMACAVCDKPRRGHPVVAPTAEEKAKEALDNAILTLKSLRIYLQEIEEKANVCWREIESEIQTLEKVRK